MRKLLLSITIIAVIAVTFGSLSIMENLTTKSYAKSSTIEIDICKYLAENIVWAVNLAEIYVTNQGSMRYSSLAANYLKLYELCECHKKHCSTKSFLDSHSPYTLADKLQRRELNRFNIDENN